jgi:hypothetical protein
MVEFDDPGGKRDDARPRRGQQQEASRSQDYQWKRELHTTSMGMG